MDTPRTIDDILDQARSRLDRVTADALPAEIAAGAVVVDIRPAAQRAQEGDVPGALVIERNVLEWRCDPASDARIPEALDHDVRWIIVCQQGYTSSLAAAALHDLGLHRATDVIGGQEALRKSGFAPPA
ncbi:rhodanese-like domain-containing protein [Williamsia sp. CHRR-6]|uniref:rhodanese-like domain-containing protein n=1 Tax=Williamsia sp. CHRR-6 TaxID=2835871 RepID=UPI001BDA1181|nr:rhodanese-like domain-containing protein [Williamsia sp. CHRR-6]MBT0565526.1 sulfurtransferase [Williamsia sp. CHRR-6]